MSKKILIFDYLKGHDFTSNLRDLTHCASFGEMATLFDVPKTTFSTWNTHNRTSHELVVRTHLRTGIPVHQLILPSDFPLEKLHHSFTRNTSSSHEVIAETSNSYNSEMEAQMTMATSEAIVTLPSYSLSNGKLVSTGTLPYAKRIFQSWNLNAASTIEVENYEGRFLIDKGQNDAVSGDYLIDMNGRLSINAIQRLPNKLSVMFGNTSLEVNDDEIKVIGRVAVSLKKQ
ncbi:MULTISPECIES: helix-turn-helix domain-containing protein [unclassified Vibrio]|uniref:helix-turn-helix domain-containing protein n=1 Tax=unclassified Vibrio TaxID=2614977 RepID=UPI001360DA60|nr:MULTISPECIES: helix-turn-helix domain-containing protein [unclassified Vibrio]NAW58967.1 chromosome partitioning protein ParA [Vibrio sp. V36_P2S2PM302]NAX24847.1 chromosome partitioning protein ParA [Vibrio sp. V38_P2S17PM301]NAX29364.1 chromosome partitioning protein ParA [Vibrio sp. V37_P2S8PM304]